MHMSKIYIFFWKEKAVIQNLVNINKDCDVCWACQVVLEVKNPPANAGDVRHGFDPWVEKIPWGGHGNPLQCSCLENPMDRGAWQASVRGVAEPDTT